MADARLSNSSVTSSAVKLLGIEIEYSWDNLVENEPLPSLFTSSSAQTEVQFMGWENPRFTIRGLIDENNQIQGAINFNLLKSFAMATTSTYFFDDVLYPNGQKVAIKSFKVRRIASDKTKKYDYTIDLIETL